MTGGVNGDVNAGVNDEGRRRSPEEVVVGRVGGKAGGGLMVWDGVGWCAMVWDGAG